jgi:hypothetical protein
MGVDRRTDCILELQPRRIFGLSRGKTTAERIKLHREGLHDLCSSVNIIKPTVIKKKGV